MGSEFFGRILNDKYITINMFEMSKTSSHSLAKKLQDLFKQYGLTKKPFTLKDLI
jgi:hypothetical protein